MFLRGMSCDNCNFFIQSDQRQSSTIPRIISKKQRFIRSSIRIGNSFFLLLLLLLCNMSQRAFATSLAKLYFRHGPVSSAKTMNLLATAYNYRVQGKSVALIKVCNPPFLLLTSFISFQPALDIRYGQDEVRSRAGLSQKADYLIRPETNILELPIAEQLIHCVLVDEVQFLSVPHIDQLRLATTAWNVPIICYGLRTDFRTQLFPGSKRLLELADCIQEIETTCHYCANKAILNLKHVNGVADTAGPTVQLGAEEKYFPTCFDCYRREVANADQSPVTDWRHDVLAKAMTRSFYHGQNHHDSQQNHRNTSSQQKKTEES